MKIIIMTVPYQQWQENSCNGNCCVFKGKIHKWGKEKQAAAKRKILRLAQEFSLTHTHKIKENCSILLFYDDYNFTTSCF